MASSRPPSLAGSELCMCLRAGGEVVFCLKPHRRLSRNNNESARARPAAWQRKYVYSEMACMAMVLLSCSSASPIFWRRDGCWRRVSCRAWPGRFARKWPDSRAGGISRRLCRRRRITTSRACRAASHFAASAGKESIYSTGERRIA